MLNIGTALFVLIIFISSVVSGAITYTCRLTLFNTELSSSDNMLLVIIFGSIFATMFCAISPVRVTGGRKKSEDWK